MRMLIFSEVLAFISSKRAKQIKVYFTGFAKNHKGGKVTSYGQKTRILDNMSLQAIQMTLFVGKAPQAPFSTCFLVSELRTPLSF